MALAGCGRSGARGLHFRNRARSPRAGRCRGQRRLGAAVQAALGLVFDPRYRDFPFAPLTAATIPLLLATKGKPATKGALLARWKRRLRASAAETAVAATLAASAVYIVCNESFANWQA